MAGVNTWLCLQIVPFFKAGDPKPKGYIECAEWARVQLAAGLRQKRCRTCQRWFFPQERHRCVTEGM